MTESITQLDSVPRDFCMFFIVVTQIDSNASSILLSLIIVSAFEFEQNILYFAA